MKVEAKLVAYLSNVLNCQVVADVPKPRPARFVSIERTGGGSSDVVIDRPIVAIQCWASTRAEALNLAQEVVSAMDVVAAQPWCYKASKNSEYNYPGEGGEPRYQLVYDMACDSRQ